MSSPELALSKAKPFACRKDRKRADIVAAAKQIFFDEGYGHASMAQIAKRVGGSKGTLYNHFASKQELLLAVVADVLEPVSEVWRSAPDPIHFDAWLHWFGSAIALQRFSADFVAMNRLITAEGRRFPEIGRMFYQTGTDPFLKLATKFFAEAIDRGVLRCTDPRAAAEVYFEICTGPFLRRALWNVGELPSEAELMAEVRFTTDIFLNGLRSTKRTGATVE